MQSIQPVLEKVLRLVFVTSILWFVLTVSWQTGWHMVGDAYALGPYLPWLELVFPVAGLGLWGAFFAQWALGELRSIHISRWFYLMFFCALLMVSVLFSVRPESSLGFVSVWLTASLMLSLQLNALIRERWFWRLYTLFMTFNLVLWFFYPNFIKLEWWLVMLWFPILWWWHTAPIKFSHLCLAWGVLALTTLLAVAESLNWFIWLSFFGYWFSLYGALRRKQMWLWGLGLVSFSLYAVFFLGFSFLSLLLNLDLSDQFQGLNNFFVGAGLGQFEWAQFQAQNEFVNPHSFVTAVPLWIRWWYEQGLLMIPMVLTLWLLSIGHNRSLKLRSALFWGTVFLAPTLWATPGGIFVGAWWFFNRGVWERANQLPAARTATPAVKPVDPRG
jgi:hypothetical protein